MHSQSMEGVVSHWSNLIQGLSASSDQFYAAVAQGLKRREIPDARIRRVEWNEGGVLSPKREYLRIEASGLAYDICAAPFGTGFFFSEWLTRQPPRWVFANLIAFTTVMWLISRALAEMTVDYFKTAQGGFGLLPWAIILKNPLVIGLASWLIAITAVGMLERIGHSDTADALRVIPVLGWIYERWFSPVTFYRLDTAAMFRASVHAAVLEAIDDLTAQKGIRSLTEEERKPVHELVPSMP